MLQGTKIDYSGQTIYVGLDIHLKSWRVTILTQHTHQKTFVLSPPSSQKLWQHLHQHYPRGRYVCTYESSFCGFWIYRELKQLGMEVLVVHPPDIPTTDKERRQKEDSRDSRKLAKQLRAGDLDAIYVPCLQQQKDRSLVRYRYRIGGDERRIKNRIKSHLYFYGIDLPEKLSKGNWSKSMLKWLADLSEQRQDSTLGLLVQQLNQRHQMQLEAMRAIRKLANSKTYNKSVSLLCSVPGIGLLTAMLLLTEIGSMKRFATFDQLCSYIGLVPSTNSSGDTIRVGDLTPRANKRLRTALIETTWTAVGQDTALAIVYEKYRHKLSAQKAIVKTARKLLRRIRRVWISGQPYVLATA